MPVSSHSEALQEERFEFFAHATNSIVAILLFSVMLVVLLQFDRSYLLGHDESVYATKAREWISGFPADQFEIYRPIGMPIASYVFQRFGDSESWLRIFGVIFGALFPAAVFFLFRQMSNLWVALSIALVGSTSYLLLEQAPRLLDDIPSSTLLIFSIGLLYSHFKSAGRRRTILLAAPIAASAFYLRYGSVTPLLVVGIFSYLLLLPKYLQVREARFSRIGQTILFGALLLAPHFLYSLSTTKSLFGILQLAGKAAHRVYLGEGLVHYLQLLPKGIGGWPLGITAILGICILILLILSPMREKYLGLTWTGCIGFTALFLTGLLVHAEPRYVILPMTLLSGTGIGGTFYLLGRYSRSIAALFLGTIYMACAWFGVLHYRELNAVFVTESTSSFNNAYREALLAIRANTGDSPCAVWSGLNKPRASWYARCITERDSSKETVTIETASHPEMTFYSVTSTRYADDTELSEDLMSSYGLFMTEIFRKDDPSTYGTMRVYRISKR